MSVNKHRPAFAVVGHPNKGKSSIVSTLARNDEIIISKKSGTTEVSSYSRIDTGNAGFELIDTPGFQRPQQVLRWLNKQASSADQRSKAVAAFVVNQSCIEQFPDEVELLKPLVDEAAILYVVDGSRPYGAEYEAEMEILRWTGRPSMALINPIENNSHSETWRAALNQYFKTVRIFNPMQADFEKQIELIQAFGHLEPSWKRVLTQVVADLKAQQESIKMLSIGRLSRLLVDLCHHEDSQKALTEQQAKSLQPLLAKQYVHWMVEQEKKTFNDLCELFSHRQCKLSVEDIQLPPDLFDSEQWYAWGLNKKQLAAVSTMSGALAGGALDMAVAGSSFMVGAVSGAIAGFGSAWFGANKLAKTKVKGLPLGGYQAVQGPIRNVNFPYVVIGRFLYVYERLKQKNHADRSDIVLASDQLSSKIKSLQNDQSKSIHLACKNLAMQKPVSELDQKLAILFD